MRAYRAGTISEAVQNAVEAVPGMKHRDVASFLGISGATLSYGTDVPEDRPAGLGVAYLHRLAVAFPEAAAPIAEHFAALAGGTFHSIDSEAQPQAMWQHVATMAKETGEAVAALSSIEHGADRAEVRREIIEAREALDAAIRDLDAQNAVQMRGAAS